MSRQRLKIITDFRNQYNLNDPAHRDEHFTDVEKCGNYINDQLNLQIDPYHIMLAAWFHDLFEWSRINHHLLAYQWVISTDYPLIANLGKRDIEIIGLSCLEHRSTWTGKYSSKLSELISAADRGFPEEDINKLIDRSIKYHMHLFKISESRARTAAIRHIKEKFGTGGTARYNDMWMSVFGDKKEEFSKKIDML